VKLIAVSKVYYLSALLSSTSTPEQKNDYVDRWGMPQPLIVFTSKTHATSID